MGNLTQCFVNVFYRLVYPIKCLQKTSVFTFTPERKKIRCVVFDGVTCRLTHLSILCLNKTMGNFMPPYEVYVLNGKKKHTLMDN